MSAISEIKDAIQKKIAGQGSQVDIGNGLPSVLNGMADLIQKSQEAIQSGFIFKGCYLSVDLPEYPDTDTNKYFALVWNPDDNYFVFMHWDKESGWDEFDWKFTPMLSAEDIESHKEDGTPTLYVTPIGLVDYCKSLSPVEEIYFDADEGGYTFGDTETFDTIKTLYDNGEWNKLPKAFVCVGHNFFTTEIEYAYSGSNFIVTCTYQQTQYQVVREF